MGYNIYQWELIGVSRVFVPGCCKEVLRVLTKKNQGCFQEVLRIFRGSFNSVSRKLLGNFMSVLGKFQWCIND